MSSLTVCICLLVLCLNSFYSLSITKIKFNPTILKSISHRNVMKVYAEKEPRKIAKYDNLGMAEGQVLISVIFLQILVYCINR